MTPCELAKMRNFLSVKNVQRIRKLLKTIDYNICTRSRTGLEIRDWFSEISDELCDCNAILYAWNEKRKCGAK